MDNDEQSARRSIVVEALTENKPPQINLNTKNINVTSSMFVSPQESIMQTNQNSTLVNKKSL